METNQNLKRFSQMIPNLVKPLLLTSVGLLIGVQSNKLLTGNELRNVRFIDNHGVKGAIIDGDTLWSKANITYSGKYTTPR
ncbi:hypothetical protein GCM10028807_36480 [Spirosoma daeguense]